MDSHDPGTTPDKGEEEASQASASTAEQDKRLAARRRFLRMGAAGSTALMVTVVHKRAFAGKKASIASNCVSLQGKPDLTTAKEKRALEVSAMGTPKGLVCRPRVPVKGDPIAGNCNLLEQDGGRGDKLSQYFTQPYPNTKATYVDKDQLKLGCGTIEDTVAKSRNYRLYEKGYCPLTYDSSTGVLSIDTNAKYYKLDGGQYVQKSCEF